MLDNSIVNDELTIGLGYNPQLEDRKQTTAEFEATVGKCKIDIYP